MHCFTSNLRFRIIFGSVLLALTTSSVLAQTTSSTDGSTPSGVAPGSPAGSYALSGFENVNLFNGHLDVHVPGLKIGGRGEALSAVAIAVNPEPWIMKGTGATHDWWTGLKPGYGPGVLQGRRIGVKFTGPGQRCSQDNLTHYQWTRTTLTFTASDGTEFELRDKQSGGQWLDAGTNYCSTGPSRGTEFVTADGSFASFISDATIVDRNRYYTNTEQYIYPSGYLILKNGVRYRIVNGLVYWVRDRNGNLLSFTHGLNPGDALTYRKVLTATDSIGRIVTFQYNAVYDTITYTGFAGAQRTITIYRAGLNTVLRSDFANQPGCQDTGGPYWSGIKRASQLFPELTPWPGDTCYNVPVITSIVLPDGRSYQFKYNPYGEVARIETPTGSAIEYDMVPGSGAVFNDGPDGPETQIHRRVQNRRVYVSKDDSTPVSSMTYSAQLDGDAIVTVDQVDPQDNNKLLMRSKHYFHGNPVTSLFRRNEPPVDYNYPAFNEGRERITESYNVTNGVVGGVLQRITSLWEAGASIATGAPDANARVKETTNELTDVGLVSKQTFSYDQYNNQTNVKEYDFGSGAPGALLREVRATYVTSTNYTNTDVNLLSLPSQTSVYDGSGVERARTTMEDDNYTTDSNHAALESRAGISGLDAAFTTSYATRGNVTATTSYLLSNGSVTGSITAYAQYDIAGNVLKAIDARGYQTTLDYRDNFGGSDEAVESAGEPANVPPAGLAGQISYAFAFKVTNALGHTAYSKYDYNLGRPVAGEDANGIVSRGYFNDSLDRPTQVRRALGTGTQSQTTFSYDDVNRIVTTTSDQNTFNDPNPLKSEVVYDGLGRTTEKRQYETASNYITVRQSYDALGRGYQTSNPFRAGEAVFWTRTTYDSLSRIISVTTPDSAAVTTAYSGNRVLVADQAGKERISKTDGLGRLKEVWEITAADSATEAVTFPAHAEVAAGYRTSYEYDTLDNLTTVTQGTQPHRTFAYDSLKRLTSAWNPESGTISYQYDANGNLTQKTDARGIVSTYLYDALNRNYSINYTNDPANTPAVTRTYDNPTNGAFGIGRLWKTQTAGSAASLTTIDSFDAMGRPVTQRQQFYSNSAWSLSYQVRRTYDLAGHVLTQTYPSGHTVNYAYDSAGRTSSFTGNLGEGVTRTYANDFRYTERGALEQEKFGTNTPLYHKQRYNQRGQLWDMRLSTVPFATDPANGDRGAIVNYYSNNFVQGGSGADNNGNLLRQENYIPGSDFFQDTFAYDSLNRLTSISEKTNGVGNDTFKQAYTFDRWGNRTIDQANTTANMPHPAYTVNTANNRLNAPAGFDPLVYDDAGNLTDDSTSQNPTATSVYDAENRLSEVTTPAPPICYPDGEGGQICWPGAAGQTIYYVYDGDGHRVRRASGVAVVHETWQVYGFDGEMLAEYSQSGSGGLGQPSKEYGYRNGQLLATAEPWVNIARNKPATQTDDFASSTTANKAVNGDTNGVLSSGSAAATNIYANSWWQVDLQSVQNIASITVWGRTDCCPEMTSNFYVFVSNTAFTSTDLNTTLNQSGVSSYYYADYAGPASININRTGRYVRVQLAGTQYLVLGEVQVWGQAAKVEWMVTDHLGTPRLISERSGSLAGIKRHDYLPFGEEIFSGTGGRGTEQGYGASDNVRQKFTQKERDIETGLDYFEARYYSSVQGRFTSPDEFTGGPDELYYFVDDASDNPTFYANLRNPQSLNKYQYAYNNPLRYVDPDGHDPDAEPEPQDPACPCTMTRAQQAQMQKGVESVLDKAAQLTGMAALADAIRNSAKDLANQTMTAVVVTGAVVVGTVSVILPKTVDPDAIPAVPPTPMVQPMPPPPIPYHPPKKQSTGKNKDHPKNTERPGRPNTKDRTGPNWRSRERPRSWPPGKPWPPWKNPRPKDWPKYEPWPPKP